MALPGRDANGSLRGPGMVRADGLAAPTSPLNAPDSPKIVYRDMPITSLVYGWTIDGIRSALSAHATGNFQQAAQLIDTVLGDDRVQATLGSRTGGLFGQEVIHDGPDAECKAAWLEQWPGLTGSGTFQEVKRWAILNGFGVAQILYDTTVTPWRQYLRPWSPQFVRWDSARRILIAQTQDGEVDIVPGAGKWFVHAPFGIYRGWLHASIRAIASKWLIKQSAWRDWARFNERHGLPILKAYVPAAGDAKQKANFVGSMATLGQEAVVGLPQNVDETGYDLELLEARDRAFETFGNTIEACDRSIILTIKSQNLTTEVSEGSFAAARQHANVEQMALEFDNQTFSNDLYEQVAKPFALFNFGDADKAVRSTWDVQPIEDHDAKAKVFMSFAQGVNFLATGGVTIDVEKTALAFGLTIEGVARAPLPTEAPDVAPE